MGEITLRFGSVGLSFVDGSMKISINNVVMGDGELISDAELIKIANSMLE